MRNLLLLKSRFVSLAVGIFLALVITSSSSQAGCPTDIVPTDSAWFAIGNVSFSIDTCGITVHYCFRKLDNWPAGTGSTTYQIYIDTIFTTLCDSIDMKRILDSVNSAVFATLPSVPPCGGSATFFATSFRAPCWKPFSNGFVPCNNASGSYCAMTCRVCARPGGWIHKDQCTFQLTGTPNCGTIPDVTGCKLIDCGS